MNILILALLIVSSTVGLGNLIVAVVTLAYLKRFVDCLSAITAQAKT